MNNITGNGSHKNSNDPSPVSVSSRDNNTSSSRFTVEAIQNAISPMDTIEDGDGIDPASWNAEFREEDEDSYSLSNEYENPGNEFSDTNTESSTEASFTLDSILTRPRPLEIVLEHLNTLHKNFPDVFLNLIFDNQVPLNLEERREYLLTRFTEKLQLLEKSTKQNDKKLLAYQLKVYMIVLNRRYQASFQRISKHIKKEYPQGEALLNKRFLSLLNRFARIQYDYPICKRKVIDSSQKLGTDPLADASAMEDIILDVEQNPEIDSLVKEIITEKIFPCRSSLFQIIQPAIDLGLLENSILDGLSKSLIEENDINKLINEIDKKSSKLKEALSKLNSMDLTLCKNLNCLFLKFNQEKNTFKEKIQKLINYCKNNLNVLFLYLYKTNCPSHFRESVFNSIILLQDLNELFPNTDERKIQLLSECIRATFKSKPNWPSPYPVLDNLIKYYSQLFPQDSCLSQLLEQLKIRGFEEQYQNRLKKRIKYLVEENRTKKSHNTIKLQPSPTSLVDRLRCLEANTDGSYTIPSDLQLDLKAILDQNKKLFRTILAEAYISSYTLIKNEIVILGRKQPDPSPVQLLINRLNDLKVDDKGNYIIEPALQFTIQQLYRNDNQLLNKLRVQGTQQGLTDKLIETIQNPSLEHPAAPSETTPPQIIEEQTLNETTDSETSKEESEDSSS